MPNFTRSLGSIGKGREVEAIPASIHGADRAIQTGYYRNGAPRLALGTIGVIFTTSRGDTNLYSRVMFVASSLKQGNEAQVSKSAELELSSTLGFLEEDKLGTFQSHDDALVVTLRIGGYDVKGVLMDQGSGAKIMYLDLYRGLNLKPKDLERYDSPLVGFDRRTIIPYGMIRLPVQAGDEKVQVNFIVVEAYSPYTVILVRRWLHAMGAVSSTLHLKVKYPTQGQIWELVRSRATTRQCLVVAVGQHSLNKVPIEKEWAP